MAFAASAQRAAVNVDQVEQDRPPGLQAPTKQLFLRALSPLDVSLGLVDFSSRNVSRVDDLTQVQCSKAGVDDETIVKSKFPSLLSGFEHPLVQRCVQLKARWISP